MPGSIPLIKDVQQMSRYSACSLVGFWAGLGWLVLVYCERKTLLAGWFGLAETNQRTGRLIIQDIYMDFD